MEEWIGVGPEEMRRGNGQLATNDHELIDGFFGFSV
jgi:hypothetical protein